jgi:hypothetical protein
MTIGNGQGDSSAKFAQYLAAARAGKLLAQWERSAPLSAAIAADLGGISPHQTQPYAVSTNTSVIGGLPHRSAVLTTAHATEIVHIGLAPYASLGALVSAPFSSAAWMTSISQITHFADYVPSLIQIESEYYGIVGAFNQVDYVREQRAQIEIDRALGVLPHALAQKTRTRLLSLSDIAVEEGLETAGPAPDSVRAAINFLAALSASRAVQLPSITLDSNGLVVMEWRKAKHESAVFRFLLDGSIGAALTTPISGRFGRPNIWLAMVTAENLRDSILTNDLWKKIIFT